jgi:DNA (cytosine-5)-methyltransferase 1
MKRPRCLDLFCGAGGAAMGLWRAGFDVVGVDIKPQPRYPFPFVRGDALRPPMRLEDFDLVWASPPCQAFTTLRNMPTANRGHLDRIPETRALLAAARHSVIENVPGAPLRHPFKLCGSMFRGLDVRRHRFFEATFPVLAPPCNHQVHTPRFKNTGTRNRALLSSVVGVYGGSHFAGDTLPYRSKAMGGMEWMQAYELTQAIPPAYSAHIGRYALMALDLNPEEYERKELFPG